MKDSFKSGDLYIASTITEESLHTTDEAAVFINDIYSVFRLTGDSVLLSDYSGLSHKVEYVDNGTGEYFTRKMTEKKAVLRLMALKKTTLEISASFFDFGKAEPTKLKVYAGGEYIAESESSENNIDLSVDMTLKPGINEISFMTEGDISGLSLYHVALKKRTR
jgi:hypothetical protein